MDFISTPEPSPSTFAIEGHWLVEHVNEHTCGTGKDGYYGAHEPGCGSVPLQDLSQMDGYAEHVAAIRAEALGEFVGRIIGPAAHLDASVKAFRAGWHQADIEGRVGERVASGLRNVIADRIETGYPSAARVAFCGICNRDHGETCPTAEDWWFEDRLIPR